MAKEFPYFKFFVSEWTDGDITLESLESQGLFINICAYYWSNKCDITVEKLIKKFKFFDQSIIENLFKNGELKDKNGRVCINFLDEQFQERMRISDKNSENVRSRYQKSTTVENSYYEKPTIKRREEKKRKEVKERKFTPPSLEQVKNYFAERGYLEEIAIKAFDYYDCNDWKDQSGKPVKSWKQKMISVWMKDEHKIQKPGRDYWVNETINGHVDTRSLFGDLKPDYWKFEGGSKK
jgi:hypothetical protein